RRDTPPVLRSAVRTDKARASSAPAGVRGADAPRQAVRAPRPPPGRGRARALPPLDPRALPGAAPRAEPPRSARTTRSRARRTASPSIVRGPPEAFVRPLANYPRQARLARLPAVARTGQRRPAPRA